MTVSTPQTHANYTMTVGDGMEPQNVAVDPDQVTMEGNLVEGWLKDHHLETYERWLDSQFSILGMRFGLDGILGLVPVVGDVATTGISAIFIADAWQIGARKRTLVKMAANVGIDFAVGSIPFVGDLFDFAFRSNTKNLRLLREEREHLARQIRQNS